MSLRGRLLLGMAVVAGVLVLSAVAITRSTREHLITQVDAQLLAAGPRLRPDLAPPEGAPLGSAPRLSDLYVGVISAEGELSTIYVPDLRGDTAPLPRLDAADVAVLRAGDAVTVPSDESGTRYRLLARSEGRQGRVAVVGLSLNDTDAAVRRLVALEGLAVATVLGILGLVTWWVIRLGVRPIRQMTATAGAIAAGDLTQRVPAGDPGTEAGQLGMALNQMLGHIEDAFDQRRAAEGRLRQFVADASHELRTPVTTIRGYAELYRTGALAEEDQLADAMRRTEQEAVRMGSLVEDLLRLARLDEGRSRPAAPVDLALIADDAVRDARATASARTIELDAPEAVVVDGDEDGLRQIVANLVTNALVHAPDAPITVRVTAVGEEAVLEVVDQGPGMAEGDAARAFERFYRVDAARSREQGGSGLGLAIVEATAQAHGGTVVLTSTPGRGTTVRVTLPRVR